MALNGFKRQYAELTGMMLKKAMKSGSNTACSPLSLYLLMMIAVQSTDGNSKKEIAEALVSGATDDEINNLIEKLPGFSKGKQLISSNGICINDSFKYCLNEGYIKELEMKFNAELFTAGSDAPQRINSWVSKKTKGMIDRMVDQLSQNFRICLLNALTFEAKWKKKYEDDDTYEDKFYGFDKESEVT